MTEPTGPAGPFVHSRGTLTEAVVVLGLPTAIFVSGTVLRLARSEEFVVRLTNGRLLGTLAVEAAMTAALLPWLLRRGWKPGQIAGRPVARDLLRGAGVWLLALSANLVVTVIAYTTVPGMAAWIKPVEGAALAPVVIAAIAILNPMFEEFLWLGYAIPTLAPRTGLSRAVAISLALRLSVHTYQGVDALVGILPLGAVFTWYFVRTGRLWPVIVAHAVMDALALAMLVARGG